MKKQSLTNNEPDMTTTVALYARVSSDNRMLTCPSRHSCGPCATMPRRTATSLWGVYRRGGERAHRGSAPVQEDARRRTAPGAPFKEILVWKFSRFTRKREHAVAFKAMLRRRGVRVVSITEHADDTPTGKLMEAIIESVDEFYSENLAQEVTRGMREAASRGFWVSSHPPLGYRRLYVQDGAKKRPRLELDSPADAVVRRIFDMVLKGSTIMGVTKALNEDGVATSTGSQWRITTVHKILENEAYTGTLVWGKNAKDGTPPVRVENAFPAIVTSQEFQRVKRLLKSRSPKIVHRGAFPARTCSADWPSAPCAARL